MVPLWSMTTGEAIKKACCQPVGHQRKEAALSGSLPLSETGLAPRWRRPVGPALLKSAGHPIIHAPVLFPVDGLGVGVLVVTPQLMPPTLVCCSRTTLAATQTHPASPAPATSLTDRAAAGSRSSGVPRRGLVPGRPGCTVQASLASPDRLPVPCIHPADPVRLAAGHLVSNPARLVAIGSTAPARSPTRG